MNHAFLKKDGDDSRNMKKRKLKNMVERVVEEVCKPSNMEDFKRNVGEVLIKAIREMIGEEKLLAQVSEYRESSEEQRSVGEGEQPRAFLEEDMIQSMLHKSQQHADLPIGSIESPVTS